MLSEGLKAWKVMLYNIPARFENCPDLLKPVNSRERDGTVTGALWERF